MRVYRAPRVVFLLRYTVSFILDFTLVITPSLAPMQGGVSPCFNGVYRPIFTEQKICATCANEVLGPVA